MKSEANQVRYLEAEEHQETSKPETKPRRQLFIKAKEKANEKAKAERFKETEDQELLTIAFNPLKRKLNGIKVDQKKLKVSEKKPNKRRRVEVKRDKKHLFIQRELNFLTSGYFNLSSESSSDNFSSPNEISERTSSYIPILTARNPSDAIGIQRDVISEWDEPPALIGPINHLKNGNGEPVTRHFGFNAGSFARNTRVDAGPILPVHHDSLPPEQKKEAVDLVKKYCSTTKGHEDLRIGSKEGLYLILGEKKKEKKIREKTFKVLKVPGLSLGKLKSGLTKLKSLDTFEQYEKIRNLEIKADKNLPIDQKRWKTLTKENRNHSFTSIRDETGVAIALVRWRASSKSSHPEIALKENEIRKAADKAFQDFTDNVKGEELDLIGSRGVHLTHHCYSRGLTAIQYDFEGCCSKCWDESPFILSGPTYNHHFVKNLRHWLWFLKAIEPIRERMHKEVYAFFPSFTNYVESLWNRESFALTHAPLFYPWTGLAFNVGNSNTNSSAVTDPHVDSKDDPNGICGVYCWGKWKARKNRGSLVIPEAKALVNLRPGDTIYFYSGRLVHYNLPVRKDKGEYRSSFVANVSNTLLTWFESGQQRIGDDKKLSLLPEKARKARSEQNLRGSFHEEC